MLKAYVDDSCMRQPPLYVLAGWCATPVVWAAFADDWDAVLRMSPRIEYFKYDEAMGFKGPFHGMSQESRDLKLKLLMSVVDAHRLTGIVTLIPHIIFSQYFGKHPSPDVRNPYFPAVYALITRLLAYNASIGVTDKVEFVFDYQPGSNVMEKIIRAWETFKKLAPPPMRGMLFEHPPTFQDDKDVLPLQAADLHAGWARELNAAALNGTPAPVPIWGTRGDANTVANFIWGEKEADEIYEHIFGYPPNKFTYSFQYGLRP
jgi:hypothetical protein